MKIVAIIFIFFAFTTFKLLFINSGATGQQIEVPTLVTPDLEFIDLTRGCAGFFDCTEYLANVVYNIGLGIIYIALLLVELVFFVGKILLLIATITFTGVEGAPGWVNALLVLPFALAIGFIVFKLIRKGSSEA